MEAGMNTVLCYGDSNTWGADPVTGERFSIHDRWAGVLRDELGSDYHVIEEGLGGRTTIWNDPMSEARNGKDYLLPCLWSHLPLDLVTIMLGTNDLKDRIARTATRIAAGVGVLVDMTLRSGTGPGGRAPRVLLICPPPIGKIAAAGELWGFGGAEEDSRRLAKYYRIVAEQAGCSFLDAGEHIVSSDIDGIHFELQEHHKLDKAVAQAVRQIFEA
jgi:lysophospholipase L1-like esterase